MLRFLLPMVIRLLRSFPYWQGWRLRFRCVPQFVIPNLFSFGKIFVLVRYVGRQMLIDFFRAHPANEPFTSPVASLVHLSPPHHKRNFVRNFRNKLGTFLAERATDLSNATQECQDVQKRSSRGLGWKTANQNATAAPIITLVMPTTFRVSEYFLRFP